MRHYLKFLALAAFIMASLIACDKKTTDSVRDGRVPQQNSLCGQRPTDKWIQGRVDLEASRSTIGLIAVSKTDVYWIPYFQTNTAFHHNDEVYFKIQFECVNNMTDIILIATDVTSSMPAASTICSGRCIDIDWLNSKSIIPHLMYGHLGGGTYHKPGHIINTTPTTPVLTKTLKVLENNVLLQSAEYQLVEIQFKDTGDKENVFVAKTMISALNASKDYFLDFYTETITGYRVLRSFSADHNHPGHVTIVKVTE